MSWRNLGGRPALELRSIGTVCVMLTTIEWRNTEDKKRSSMHINNYMDSETML